MMSPTRPSGLRGFQRKQRPRLNGEMRAVLLSHNPYKSSSLRVVGMSLNSFTEALIGGWTREYANKNSKTTFYVTCKFDGREFHNFGSLENHFKKEHMDKITEFALRRGVEKDVWNDALKRMKQLG